MLLSFWGRLHLHAQRAEEDMSQKGILGQLWSRCKQSLKCWLQGEGHTYNVDMKGGCTKFDDNLEDNPQSDQLVHYFVIEQPSFDGKLNFTVSV